MICAAANGSSKPEETFLFLPPHGFVNISFHSSTLPSVIIFQHFSSSPLLKEVKGRTNWTIGQQHRSSVVSINVNFEKNVELLFISGCLTNSRIILFGRENSREQIYSIKLDCLANSCDTNFEQHSQANTQCQLLFPNSGLLALFFSSIGWKHFQRNIS